MLFLNNADIDTRIEFSKVLGDDVHDFTSFKIFPSSFIEHVATVVEMSRITKICHDRSRFPCAKEWIEDYGSHASVSLDRVDMIESMTGSIS